MLKNTLPRPNLRLLVNDAQPHRTAAALLHRLADELEAGDAAGWRGRLTAVVGYLLDGSDADLDAGEILYLREVLRVSAADLPVLER